MSSGIRDFAAVSVVIPCFRSGTTIRRAINSVMQQTLRPREVIIVDDASSDETPAVLHDIQREYPDLVRIILLQKNVGAASARNAGWRAATQPYVAFLDSDDSWHPDKLRIQYTHMAGHPELSVTGHLCEVAPNGNRSAPIQESFSIKEIKARQLVFRNYFSTPTVMVKRDLPVRFTEGKRYAEDHWVWQSNAFLGQRIVRLELTLAYLYKAPFGDDGLSANLVRMELGELDNLLRLWRQEHISFVCYSVAVALSLIKFCKRFIVTRLQRLAKYQISK